MPSLRLDARVCVEYARLVPAPCNSDGHTPGDSRRNTSTVPFGSCDTRSGASRVHTSSNVSSCRRPLTRATVVLPRGLADPAPPSPFERAYRVAVRADELTLCYLVQDLLARSPAEVGADVSELQISG